MRTQAQPGMGWERGHKTQVIEKEDMDKFSHNNLCLEQLWTVMKVFLN